MGFNSTGVTVVSCTTVTVPFNANNLICC